MTGPFQRAREQLISTREAFIGAGETVQAAQVALELAATRFHAVYGGVNIAGRQTPQRIGRVRKDLVAATEVITAIISSINDEILRISGGN